MKKGIQILIFTFAIILLYCIPITTSAETKGGDGVIKEIYLDPVNGDDSNSGNSQANAFQTLGKALSETDSDDIIYICNVVNINTDLEINNRYFKRLENYTGPLISVNQNITLTLANVVLDGDNGSGNEPEKTGYIIFIDGTFHMKDGVELINNDTTAVYVNNGASFEMTGGLISNNRWTQTNRTGAAAVNNCGTTIISGGEISDNSSVTYAGGILNQRNTVTLSGNVEIKNNRADFGAGVTTLGATTILDGASINNNYANYGGGGVYVQGSGDETSFIMKSGSITGNTANNYPAGGIYVSDYDGKTILQLSGGTIADNTTGNYGSGEAITLWQINGNDVELQLSGSPLIAGDVFCIGNTITVTDSFTPQQPILLSRNVNTFDTVAVHYANGLTPKTEDFVSSSISETLTINGQNLIWTEAVPVYFYEADGQTELEKYRQGVAIGNKIDVSDIPSLEKTGYLFVGWKNQRTGNLWNFDKDTVSGDKINLTAVWKLQEPKVSIISNTSNLSEGQTAVLTAVVSHPLGNSISYQYQWYKDGKILERQTGSSLSISEAGTYTVKVSATDGSISSEEVTANSVLISKQISKQTALSASEIWQNTIRMDSKTSIKTSNKSLKITWKKVPGADGYDVYATACSEKFTGITKTVNHTAKSVTIKKIKGKKLRPQQSYKVKVRAYRMVNGKKEYIANGSTFHAVLPNNKTYTNAKSIKVNKKKYILKKGKKTRIRTVIVKQKKNLRLLSKGHGPTLTYTSSNSAVASVSKNGKLKAKKKGKCFIYVRALNGTYKKIKVTVK